MMKIVFTGKKIRSYMNQEEGSLLIEGFMSLVSLFIICSAVFSAFVAGFKTNGESEDRTVAANMARYIMEELMDADYNTVVYDYPPGERLFYNEPTGNSFWKLNSEGTWVTVLPEGKYEISYPGYDSIPDPDVIPDPLPVIVKLSWAGPNGKDAELILRTILDD